jgi:hypothetical protein
VSIEANFSSVRGFTMSYKIYAAGCFAVHSCLLWADVTDIKKKWQARMSSPFLLKLFFMESVTNWSSALVPEVEVIQTLNLHKAPVNE